MNATPNADFTTRVIATYGKEYRIQQADQDTQLITANRKVGKAVCGDWINSEDGRLTGIKPRQTEYIRPDFRNRPKTLTANTDTLIWLTSHTPPNDPLIAARAILVSRLLNHELIIVQSKIDSLPKETPEHLQQAKQLAEQCGIRWFETSVKTELGLGDLVSILSGRSCLIVGQSGVGKSTLVAKLTGDDSIKTQTVSEKTGHGRHTTTTAILYRDAALNVELIDAPGMRDIGLWEMPAEKLLNVLPEVTNVAGECRFHNCRHQQEPDCAVKQARQEGKIPELLYLAYEDAQAKELLS